MSGRLNIGIIGATGRFGSQIVKAAVERGWSLDFQRSSSTEARTTGRPSVLFECARAEATLQTIETALSFGSTLVLATSGRTAVHDAAVAKAAGSLSGILCARHSMSTRSMYAEQKDDEGGAGRSGGDATDSQGHH